MLKFSAERRKISIPSNPSAAACLQPSARSSQNTKGPPRASGTSEMVMAESTRLFSHKLRGPPQRKFEQRAVPSTELHPKTQTGKPFARAKKICPRKRLPGAIDQDGDDSVM